jgi:L-iditol 2-dehydrogenase
MKASVVRAPGRIEVDEFELPRPGPGEVLVRIERAAICGSDIHCVDEGHWAEGYPTDAGWPGHEAVGTIVDGNTDAARRGDRVLLVPIMKPNGTFAEYMAVAPTSLVKLPLDDPADRLLMAQQLGTVLFSLKRYWRDGDLGSALVFGAGPAGLYFVQVLRRRGVDVTLSEPHAGRRAIAERLGARVVDPAAGSPLDVTMEVTEGAGADLVVEAAGTPGTRTLAVAAVRRDGVIGLFGHPAHGAEPFPLDLVWRKALRIEAVTGTQREPGLASFREAVELISRGAIEVDYLLNSSFPLDAIDEAFEAARSRNSVKVQLEA